jgi:hypothetical protein
MSGLLVDDSADGAAWTGLDGSPGTSTGTTPTPPRHDDIARAEG